MRKIFLVTGFLLLAPAYAFAFTLSNFSTPESFVVDPEDGSYYVSNINGEPLAKDGNGYISKISSSGKTVIQRFIGGTKGGMLLNAPKGLAVIGKNIFVTDIDTVKAFDKENSKPVVLVDLSLMGAKFLNDLAWDGAGALYVSDTMANKIFKIDLVQNYAVSVFKEGPGLGNPNGLFVNPRSKNLMVVTWGSGQILEIDPAGKVHLLKKSLLTLDGVDSDGQGNLLISSFEKGEVYKIKNYGRGTLKTVLSGLTTPADISFDKKKNEIFRCNSRT
jgi:DNA-binding beta-propeller fold protein YncE